MGNGGKRKGKGKKGREQGKAAVNGAANGAASSVPPEAEPESGRESEPEAAGDDPGPPPEQIDAPGEPEPELVAAATGAAWAAPLHRLDEAWTKLESRLLVWVLLGELLSLSAWVLLNDSTDNQSFDGALFRALVGAIVVGTAGWFLAKNVSKSSRTWIALGAAVVGAFVAILTRSVGIAYLNNLKGWLQEGSTLTLMGGLRGVATRLTLWLALLGGSLATGAGRHIHVDLVYRLLPKRFRLPASLLNTAAATLVCFAGVWGFFDHIAINSFGAKAEDTAGQKIADVGHGIGEHLFLTRKQIGLDLRTLPHVLTGDRYDHWMTGPAWNAWVDDGGFADHYTAEQVASIKVPEETATHAPLVVSPDGTTTRGMLTHVLGLVFPFGLFAIGLRFILRALLTLSGHYKPDTEEAHEEFSRKVEETVR